jgi:ligand-binding SRPBCC domain-containing protein
MAEYRFTACQTIARPRPEVFEFFSRAEHLERITPPEVGFHIITPTPITIGEGTLIDYRLSLRGLPVRWQSRITVWDPPFKFADEQVRGPYKQWIHTHRFTEVDAGTTEMEDEVLYRLPLEPFGDLAQLFVEWEIKNIFDYRKKTIEELFAAGK